METLTFKESHSIYGEGEEFYADFERNGIKLRATACKKTKTISVASFFAALDEDGECVASEDWHGGFAYLENAGETPDEWIAALCAFFDEKDAEPKYEFEP